MTVIDMDSDSEIEENGKFIIMLYLICVLFIICRILKLPLNIENIVIWFIPVLGSLSQCSKKIYRRITFSRIHIYKIINNKNIYVNNCTLIK